MMHIQKKFVDKPFYFYTLSETFAMFNMSIHHCEYIYITHVTETVLRAKMGALTCYSTLRLVLDIFHLTPHMNQNNNRLPNLSK